MLKKLTIAFAASAAALLAATTSGMAQTKLKWAHVYETSEPFHTASVWAAGEIGKRTNGRYADRRLSGLAARQGNRHQPGALARLGRHDHFRLELCGEKLSADRRDLLSLHLPRRRPSPGLHQERRLQGAHEGLRGQDRPSHPGGDLLRRASHLLEQADQDLRRHEGPQDSRARRAGLSRDAARLRRQHRADRVCRGLSRPAERHRRSPGKSAHDHRGQEVLRGAEAYRADRPHRRSSQHRDRPARSGRSCPRKTARSSPTSRRKRPPRRPPRSRPTKPSWSISSSRRA